MAVAVEQLGALLQPIDLVRLERDREVAGELQVAVDPVAPDVRDEAVEVLPAEALELRHLRGEAREAVLDPVRERAEREAAVPPAGAEADRVRLEDDDVPAGVVGLRVKRRPEPGEAAADDAEIGLVRAFEPRLRLPRGKSVEPVRPHRRVGEGGALRLCRRARGPRERHDPESTVDSPTGRSRRDRGRTRPRAACPPPRRWAT